MGQDERQSNDVAPRADCGTAFFRHPSGQEQFFLEDSRETLGIVRSPDAEGDQDLT